MNGVGSTLFLYINLGQLNIKIASLKCLDFSCENWYIWYAESNIYMKYIFIDLDQLCL